ncbi:MAG: DUF642 domain-containing protein [Colwellia sp.]|nr:DUF642 domain-containing protein [Colwellia sp.]
MQKFLKSFILSVFTLSVFILSASANAGLITNGSFESLYDASGGEIVNKTIITEYTPGDGNRADYLSGLTESGNWGIYDSLLGWSTINAAGIEVQYSGAVVDASDGNNYLELDTHTNGTAGSNGGIYQSVTGLTIGQSYLLSFDYQGRLTDKASNEMTVSLTEGTNYVFKVSEEFTNKWTTYTHSFIASATAMKLQFEGSGTADSKGALLDNVSLSAVSVPEPSVISLMLIALCGIAMRKKS